MANYSDLMKGVGKNIQEIAASISKSDYAKRLVPTVDQLKEETYERLNRSLTDKAIEKAKREGNEEIVNAIYGNINNDGKYSGAKGEKIKNKLNNFASNNINLSNYESEIDKLLKKHKRDLNKETDINEMSSALKDMYKSIIDDNSVPIDAGVNSYNNKDILNKGLSLTKTYFSSKDKKTKLIRGATVAGVYAGLNIGGRVLTGGSLTANNSGEKDIAGIPFI